MCKGINNNFLFVQAKSPSKPAVVAELKQPSTGKSTSGQIDKSPSQVTSVKDPKVKQSSKSSLIKLSLSDTVRLWYTELAYQG